MEAITKYGSHSQALALSRSCWRLNINSSYHYPLTGSLPFSRNQSPKKLHLVRAKTNPTDDNSTNRSFTPFPPSLWGDHFLSATVNPTDINDLWTEIEALLTRVNAMLLPSNVSNSKQIICLIHTLISLGVSYHFENEIVEFLNDASENVEDMIIDCKEDDLYTVSVMFRVFRLYGHNISSDIFNRFKEDDGNFKKCLVDDVRGMLSFYEASNFGTATEDILDEAMSFTQKHLELFVVGVKATNHPHISKLIQNALYLPQNYDLEVLVAREYIRFYEQDTDHNETLLKLAKLNFKFLQLHYIQDLKTLTAWWKELGLVSKIPNYFKDRVVELYFWATAILYEPQYSPARIRLAKSLILFNIVDNTFDAYGTLDESKSLVQCVERWETDAIDVLPDYIKTIFGTIFDLFKELEEEKRSEGRSLISVQYAYEQVLWETDAIDVLPDYIKTIFGTIFDLFKELEEEKRSEGRSLISVQYAYEQLKLAMRGFLQEAKCARAGHVPSYEEYIEVGMSSTAMEMLLAIIFIGMGEIAGDETYEWLGSRPKLTQALLEKSRLRDDISTFKDEMSKGDVANGINCYIKQYGVTEEKAALEFEKRINHLSKVMNEEFLKSATFVPLQILRPVLNCGRLADLAYKYGDGFTYAGEKTKDYITSLYVDLINL